MAASMWIMISGPYTAGAKTQADRDANLAAMNAAAYEVFKLGHTPIIGVNLALPVIGAAGAERFDRIMMPLSLALAKRCDAVLRIGGPSGGADAEVAVFAAAGKPIFGGLESVPRA